MVKSTVRRATVMGLGRFGGGLGVTRWLVEQGIRVVVTDRADAARLAEPIASMRDLIDAGQVDLHLGGHDMRDFTEADLVVANPAVPKPWANTFLIAARDAAVPIRTEMRLLIERLGRQRVIGVTGSAGKSTTAAMIHHVLTRCGRSSTLGGNIGGSLLGSFDTLETDAWVVLELSSFMLYWLGPHRQDGFDAGTAWSPHVAVLTNIEPNHLDWHGSYAHYEQCKLQITRDQQSGDHAIDGREMRTPSEPVPLAIPGMHNQINAELAVQAAEAVGISRACARAALADFAGLPHRLQLVVQRGNQRFYNDSKSTTPQATLRAVGSFDDPGSVHLIAGGYDKGADLTAIADLAVALAGLYTIGATGEAIADAAGRRRPNVYYCDTLDRAVDAAMGRMGSRDLLLLSPGCASWDQFADFEQRGDRFTHLITQDR